MEVPSHSSKQRPSMSIKYRSEAKVSDRYLIDTCPRAFAIWDRAGQSFISHQNFIDFGDRSGILSLVIINVRPSLWDMNKSCWRKYSTDTMAAEFFVLFIWVLIYGA